MHWETLFTSYGTDNCREAAVGCFFDFLKIFPKI
jgi:hypothetical protein